MHKVTVSWQHNGKFDYLVALVPVIPGPGWEIDCVKRKLIGEPPRRTDHDALGRCYEVAVVEKVTVYLEGLKDEHDPDLIVASLVVRWIK